jgi:hypothetical protein
MTDIIQPNPDEVRAAREDAKLDRASAASLVHLGHAVRWAEYETGQRCIDTARWELFLLKTGQHPDQKLIRRSA